MDITGEHEIAATREAVWRALNNPEVLAQTIPGCESMEQLSETEFSAKIQSRIGPVKAKFNCKIELADRQPPDHYTLLGEGQGGVAGFAQGSAEVQLNVIADERTQLTYRAEFKIGGKLAQIGSRLVAGASRKTADQFFANFAEYMESNS